jgi:hypothetical protein
MNKKELNKILEQHKLWLESDGEKGERADLRGANLRHADLWNADLRHADLQDADLQDAHLRRADLRGAKLDTNIRDCWIFRHVKVTQDALPWLILHPKWSEFKNDVQIHPS